MTREKLERIAEGLDRMGYEICEFKERGYGTITLMITPKDYVSPSPFEAVEHFRPE
jgi:hypothetical protein